MRGVEREQVGQFVTLDHRDPAGNRLHAPDAEPAEPAGSPNSASLAGAVRAFATVQRWKQPASAVKRSACQNGIADFFEQSAFSLDALHTGAVSETVRTATTAQSGGEEI